MHPLRRRATLSIGLVSLGLLVACSEGGEPTPAQLRPQEVKPGTGAADAFGPVSPPAGFAEVSGEGFTLAAPAGFEAERRASSNGEPMLLLNAVQSPGTLVGVVRDVHPRADAIEQSITLETSTRLVQKATDVAREEIEWPGAQQAVLVRWTALDEQQGAPAPPVPHGAADGPGQRAADHQRGGHRTRHVVRAVSGRHRAPHLPAATGRLLSRPWAANLDFVLGLGGVSLVIAGLVCLGAGGSSRSEARW